MNRLRKLFMGEGFDPVLKVAITLTGRKERKWYGSLMHSVSKWLSYCLPIMIS